MEMNDLSCAQFLAQLASKAPTPGGGGTAALVGAAGVALGNMVGCLTTGKKKYAVVEADIQALNARAEALRLELEALVQADADAFAPLAAAYGLPKDTRSRPRTRLLCWKPHWTVQAPCRCKLWKSAPRASRWRGSTPPKAACWQYRMQAAPPCCARRHCRPQA